MIKYTIIVLLLLSNLVLFAQDRYLELSFDEILVETQTYISKDGENLDLDVYRPEYDSELYRPLVMYVHGGGFRQGTRDSERIREFCTRLARHGYVVASISYRLTRKGHESAFGCDCPADDKMNTFYAAVEDVQDATHFLIQNREIFGIDPQKMILAGSSAGAETVLNTAYQPPYCYGLDSGPVSFAGVIGMAGAIPDTVAIYEESAVPSLLFHGTDDNLVPYGSAPHHYCDEDDPGYLMLHGSKSIAHKLNQLGTPNWLYTNCGGTHDQSWKPMVENFDVILDFCYNFVIHKNGESRHTVIEGAQNTTEYKSYNFCTE